MGKTEANTSESSCFLMGSCTRHPRDAVRHFIEMFNNRTCVCGILLSCIITVSRFSLGSMKLTSECHEEYVLAMNMFVQSIFAATFWIAIILLMCQKKLINSLNNPCVEVCVILETLFSLGWFIFGIVWLAQKWDVIRDCPADGGLGGEPELLLISAFCFGVFDFIKIAVFVLYSGYDLCESNMETDKPITNETNETNETQQ